MRLKEIEKLKKKELRQRVDEAFEKSDEKGPGYLAEAQFYMRELEHRRDSWVSIRDFVLEIVVIVLIGAEIYMSIRAERLQRTNFADEKVVFGNLQKSSGATVDSLLSAKDILAEMKLSAEKQLELYYEVQLNPVYFEASKKLTLINDGHTRIELWGTRITNDPKVGMLRYPNAHFIAPGGGTVEFALDDAWEQMSQGLPKGQERPMDLVLLLKNEKGERFTLIGELIASWKGDALIFKSQVHRLVPGWTSGALAKQ